MITSVRKAGYNFCEPTAYYSQTFPKIMYDNLELALNSTSTITFRKAHQAYTFKILSDNVINECYVTSSPTKIMANTSFKNIVEMGKDIVGLLIEDLEKNPNYWIPALYLILETNPIKKENEGVVSGMISDWKNWAIENGYTNK